MIKKFFHSLFFEGIIYACTWLGVFALLSYLIHVFLVGNGSENVSVWVLNLGLWLTWILSSVLFSFYKGESSWQIGTLKYMCIGLMNMALIYLAFWIYSLNQAHLDEHGLDVFRIVFMYLWNFFSAGSSDFLVAFLTLMPTLIVFALMLAGIAFGLNTLFYIFTKPMADKLFSRKNQ